MNDMPHNITRSGLRYHLCSSAQKQEVKLFKLGKLVFPSVGHRKGQQQVCFIPYPCGSCCPVTEICHSDTCGNVQHGKLLLFFFISFFLQYKMLHNIYGTLLRGVSKYLCACVVERERILGFGFFMLCPRRVPQRKSRNLSFLCI